MKEHLKKLKTKEEGEEKMRKIKQIKQKNSNKGITLIALVITIIVLLILAAVSIATLTGENGILTKANDAKIATEQADAEEQVKVAVMASYDDNGNLDYGELKKNLDQIPKIENVPGEITESDFPLTVTVNGYDVTIEDNGGVKGNEPVTPPTGDKPGKPDDNGIFTVSSTIDGKTEPESTPEDASKNPMIPAGFEPVTKIEDPSIGDADWGDGTKLPKVEEGLVIQDIDGNQFVWVPVPKYEDFKRVADYYDGNLHTYYFQSCGEANAEGINDKATETEETKAEAKAMYASVKKYGGFYIGRYEAGAEGGKLEKTSDYNGKWTEEPTLVCKKGATVYNYIKWGNSITDGTGGAVEKARKMKDGKKWKTTAISTLIYGVQWDATMQFFDEQYINNNCLANSYVRNSTGKGNYNEEANTNTWKNTLTTTGALSAYAEKNIYDMAGNASEWTMEYADYSDNYRVYRGGSYDYTGFKYPASNRDIGHYPSGSSNYNSFRVALYVR